MNDDFENLLTVAKVISAMLKLMIHDLTGNDSLQWWNFSPVIAGVSDNDNVGRIYFDSSASSLHARAMFDNKKIWGKLEGQDSRGEN